MRTKDDILTATMDNAAKASSPKDVSLIHELHMLEVLIDIRDIFAATKKTLNGIHFILSNKQ